VWLTSGVTQEMAERSAAHQMELVWRGSPAFGPESDLWVSVSPSGTYTTPNNDWVVMDRHTQSYVPQLWKVRKQTMQGVSFRHASGQLKSIDGVPLLFPAGGLVCIC
jgi:hypothetical protein